MFRVLLLIVAIILVPLNLSAISFVDLQNKDNYTKVYGNQDKSVYVNKNYANIKSNESRQQEVESEFYEVKKNGQIFSVRAIFAYDKNYNFLSYQREIKALYPNILSEDWLALIHVRKHRNSGVKINVQGAGVFDYNGKLVTKGPLSKDDNRFVDIKFTSDRYYVAEYVYFYAYGSHFDESEKRW